MFASDTQYPKSWYADSVQPAPATRPPLASDLDTEVLIVGGGFTGLYTAYHLATAGVKVSLIEASRIGWAASGRNGGQLILGFSSDMPPIEAALGKEKAREIWDALREAGQFIRQLIHTHQVDCALTDGHLWTSVLWQRIRLLSDWQEEAATAWGYDHLAFIPRKDLPNYVDSPRYVAGLYDKEGGHLNPLKYILGLAKVVEGLGVSLYENTKAIRYQKMGDGYLVNTEKGQIRCRKLVLATNAYIDRLDTQLSARILPVGTYMIATEPLPTALAQQLLPNQAAVSDNQFILDYFRLSEDNRLLFGGKCTYSGKTPSNLTEGMRQDMVRVFPQLKAVKISHTWGGHIDISVHRTPDIGKEGDKYWAQGFSGHGVIPTSLAGKVIADAILGNDRLLQYFMQLNNPAFPGGNLMRVPLQAAGMAWYRLKDYPIPGLAY